MEGYGGVLPMSTQVSKWVHDKALVGKQRPIFLDFNLGIIVETLILHPFHVKCSC